MLTGQACELRKEAYGAKNYTPTGDTRTMVVGTYYLVGIDEEYRRTYAIKQ